MKKFNPFTTATLLFALLFSSCTADKSCESLGTCPEFDPQKVMERVDIKLTGENDEVFYDNILQENTTTDLVTYNFYPNSSSAIDFIIQLGDDKTLTIKLHHSNLSNPWEVPNYYGTFPAQSLDDKVKYVTVHLKDNQFVESSTFISNIGDIVPRGGQLDVFRIEKYSTDDMSLLCRINNLELFQLGNASNSIVIDGTFRGALTFL